MQHNKISIYLNDAHNLNKPMELSDFLLRYTKGFCIDVLRYILFAGGAFLIFYVLFKNTFSRFKIQQKFPEILHYKREIGYSFYRCSFFRLWEHVYSFSTKQVTQKFTPRLMHILLPISSFP